MQQTAKYKLNLIESSDPFLPEGLNQNTQKIEDAMAAHEAAVAADMSVKTTALEQKITKLACGSIELVNQTVQTVALGFTPKTVLAAFSAMDSQFRSYLLAVGSEMFYGSGNQTLQLTQGGFQVKGGSLCVYVALG